MCIRDRADGEAAQVMLEVLPVEAGAQNKILESIKPQVFADSHAQGAMFVCLHLVAGQHAECPVSREAPVEMCIRDRLLALRILPRSSPDSCKIRSEISR